MHFITTVNPADEILQCLDLGLDAGLGENKIILQQHECTIISTSGSCLNAVQQLAEAPKTVGLNVCQVGQRQRVNVKRIQSTPLCKCMHSSRISVAEGRTQMGREKHDEERHGEVVDALHVAAARVPNRPNIQDPPKQLRAVK